MTQGMKRPDPLLASWAQTLARRSADGAIFDTRGGVARTFAAIEEEAGEFARGELGQLAAGSVIAIQIGNQNAWPALLLACWRSGLVVLPLDAAMAEQERGSALKVCRAATVITAAGSATMLRRVPHEPIAWDGDIPVLLKLTSGTTAAPRAIRFKSDQLLADCAQICETMGITAGDLNFAVIPVSHSYGFSNLLTPLLARGVPLVLSQDRMPRAVLDDLARTGATVFPGMPVFFQAFCELEQLPALPKLRLSVSAGAPLPLPVAHKFREKFGLSIHSFYGSSECGGICFDREAPLAEQGFVGRALTGVDLDMLDPETPASRIRVRSAAAGDGYFPEPDPEKLGRGYFLPDDLLRPVRDGFRIVGRVSDVINVAGKKVNPAEVEAVLLGFEGVRAAVVFGRGSALRNEEVAACVVADSCVAERELLEFCRHRLSGWQTPRRIFFLEEMPVTERGKISRRDLARRFSSKQ